MICENGAILVDSGNILNRLKNYLPLIEMQWADLEQGEDLSPLLMNFALESASELPRKSGISGNEWNTSAPGLGSFQDRRHRFNISGTNR